MGGGGGGRRRNRLEKDQSMQTMYENFPNSFISGNKCTSQHMFVSFVLVNMNIHYRGTSSDSQVKLTHLLWSKSWSASLQNVDCCFDHFKSYLSCMTLLIILTILFNVLYSLILECWYAVGTFSVYLMTQSLESHNSDKINGLSKVNSHVAYCFHVVKLFYPLETQVFLIIQFHLLGYWVTMVFLF